MGSRKLDQDVSPLCAMGRRPDQTGKLSPRFRHLEIQVDTLAGAELGMFPDGRILLESLEILKLWSFTRWVCAVVRIHLYRPRPLTVSNCKPAQD